MDTSTPLAVVDPEVLLLLLKLLKLDAYPPKYNEMPPPYTCVKTSRHSASHTHRQYNAAGADPKALTLAPYEPKALSVRGTRVTIGKLKNARTVKTHD